MFKFCRKKTQSLKELPINTPGVIKSINTSDLYKDKLHALGISEGSTIFKTNCGSITCPILVKTGKTNTHERSELAISDTLAEQIILDI